MVSGMKTLKHSRPVALVTGATDGLGKATAIRLAGAGMSLILHGRSPQRVDAAIALIRQRHPHSDVRGVVGDFSSLACAFDVVDAVRAQAPRLDLLVNNAGIGIEEVRTETSDGHESAMQINYLAGYVLTIGLQPMLDATAGRTICITSSSQQPIDVSDPDFNNEWNGTLAYARSKWAQAAFCTAWATRRPHAPSTIHAVHPGDFMPTKLVVGRFPVVHSLEHGVDRIISVIEMTNAFDANGMYFDGVRHRLPDGCESSELLQWLLRWSEAAVTRQPAT